MKPPKCLPVSVAQIVERRFASGYYDDPYLHQLVTLRYQARWQDILEVDKWAKKLLAKAQK